MATNQKIAGAAVVLTANADGMVAGLNRAKEHTKRTTKDMQGFWEKLGQTFGGGGGEFITKTLGAGFFGGIAGSLAIRSFNAIRDVVRNIVSGTADWQAELAKVQFQAAELNKTYAHIMKVRDEWTEAATPEERRGRLKFDVGSSTTTAKAAEAALATARERLRMLNDDAEWGSWVEYFSGNLEREKAQAQAAVAALEAELIAANERIRNKSEELKRLTDPSKYDPKLKGAVNEFTKATEFARLTLGMTAEEAQLLKFELDGANAAMLAGARMQVDLLKRAREMADVAQKGVQFAGAVERGTREAYSMEIRQKFGTPEGLAKDDRIILEQKETNRQLGQVVDYLLVLKDIGVI